MLHKQVGGVGCLIGIRCKSGERGDVHSGSAERQHLFKKCLISSLFKTFVVVGCPQCVQCSATELILFEI